MMAGKGTVLIVLMMLPVAQPSSFIGDDLSSPLDISYIINNVIQDSGLAQPSSGSNGDPPSSGAYGGPPSSSGGYDEYYGQSPGDYGPGNAGPAKTSLYSNNAGDTVYDQNLPVGSYNTPEGAYPTGYSDNAGQPPLTHIVPMNPYDGVSSQQGSGLSSFGQSLGDSHYPIEVPAASPDDYNSWGRLDKYTPKARKILPSPYSGQEVPYAVKPHRSNDKRNNNDNGNYDVYDDGYSQGSKDLIPQAAQEPLPPSKDLLDVLISNYPPPVVPGVPDTPDKGYYGNDNSVPVGGDYPPYGGSADKTLPSPGGSGVGDSRDPYAVAPDHLYPADVHQYRDELKCWPAFFLQYDHDFSGVVWQDVKGQVSVEQGRAVFTGQGFLAIPFFACNDLLPRYSMIFVIRPLHTIRRQAVIGNSLFPSEASLLVSLLEYKLTLVIRQRKPNLTAEQLLQQCYKHKPHLYHDRRRRSVGSVSDYGSPDPGQYGQTYDVVDDIVELQVNITGEVTVTIAQENGWIFFSAGDQHDLKPGRLPTLTNEALYVGAGADPRGGKLDLYSGTFDSFLFEKCP